MKRLESLFENKKKDILNIYTTAGYPQLGSTVEVVVALDKAGVDIVEIGMPYSDPMADGETIQLSSKQALENGMSLQILFEQIKEIRTQATIPIILMGYLNQIIQYGTDSFLAKCQEVGVDSLIIPDLPLDIYEEEYLALIEQYGLGFSFLVTPQTSDTRILKAAKMTSSFLYVVSQSSTTGKSKDIQDHQVKYFKRLQGLNIGTPQLIGFGIHDKASFYKASSYANGAIIGSAFIKHLKKNGDDLSQSTQEFVNAILD